MFLSQHSHTPPYDFLQLRDELLVACNKLLNAIKLYTDAESTLSPMYAPQYVQQEAVKADIQLQLKALLIKSNALRNHYYVIVPRFLHDLHTLCEGLITLIETREFCSLSPEELGERACYAMAEIKSIAQTNRKQRLVEFGNALRQPHNVIPVVVGSVAEIMWGVLASIVCVLIENIGRIPVQQQHSRPLATQNSAIIRKNLEQHITPVSQHPSYELWMTVGEDAARKRRDQEQENNTANAIFYP